MSDPSSLRDYVAELMAVTIIPRPPDEAWGDMIARISVPGRVAAIEEDTWDYFLECLPPKFLTGGLFAFAEGAEPLRIFWKRHGLFFVRLLTWDVTTTFCRLAGILLPN